MEKTLYRYWYEFLKRSVKYRSCCDADGDGELAALYCDFGDIHRLSFENWFTGHKHLFANSEPLFVLKEIRKYSDLVSMYDEGDDDMLVLVIDLHAPKQKILGKVDSILRAKGRKELEEENARSLAAHNRKTSQQSGSRKIKDGRHIEDAKPKNKKKVGRPRFDPSFIHWYGLTPKPDEREVKSYKTMLAVYDACLKEDKKPKHKRQPRWEIGRKLRLLDDLKNSNASVDKEAWQNRMSATVSRYFRKAKSIIESTEYGSFPRRYEVENGVARQIK